RACKPQPPTRTTPGPLPRFATARAPRDGSRAAVTTAVDGPAADGTGATGRVGRAIRAVRAAHGVRIGRGIRAANRAADRADRAGERGASGRRGPRGGGGLLGEWGRLVQSAPTVFFWYTRLSGILSLLAWISH